MSHLSVEYCCLQAIFLLPEESYAAQAAYKALEQFSSEEVSACQKILRENHMIVKRRGDGLRKWTVANRLTASVTINAHISEDFVTDYKRISSETGELLTDDHGMTFDPCMPGAANAVALTQLVLDKVRCRIVLLLSTSH
jgi:hypothetical protein